ncbi:hypothetical protein M407DRAFT_234026 [Tulasnella calospora MUT 4182]|uniref:F-box domain-containing protein n=1 Tax=Tulasnella calospora MUT 4182 TaxID=1051891 RepID=A0A0C3L2R4_9AGAM|nr:hypothetical protein M407DRAFT_234026 [Tulasnella calospora MUT 4182]
MHNPETTLHSLPTELLSHILLLTLSEDPWAWDIRDVRTLALVCSSTFNLRIANLVLKRNLTGPLDIHLVEDYWTIVRRLEFQSTEQHLRLAFSGIESAEFAQSLNLLHGSPGRTPLISLCRLTRLRSLRLVRSCIDGTNLPRLPCLRVLEINHTPIPRIEYLHALLGFAPGLESIEFRRLWSSSDLETGLGANEHQLSGLQPVSLSALRTLELYDVPTNWSAHVLTIIQPSRALSLSATYADSSVFHNPNFHQLATHALIGSGCVRVSVANKTMNLIAERHLHTGEGSTELGAFRADFIMHEFAGWPGVFRGLGAIVSSNSMLLNIGLLGEIGITDLVETLKNAPNILPSIRTIQISGGDSSIPLLGLLSREYVDDLGQVTWLASGLEELILDYRNDGDYESTMAALRQLWLERYARLETNGGGPSSARSLKGCSRLSRLSFRIKGFVTKVKEDGLFPGTAVDTFVR